MSMDKLIDRYAEAITAEGYGYLAALATTIVFAVLWRIATTPRRPAVTEPISAEGMSSSLTFRFSGSGAEAV